MKKSWVIPPQQDATFIYQMEKVLDLYAQPYDPKRPVICMDEANRQLVREVKQPIPMKSGQPQKYDSHYERAGVCNLFLFCEPLKGWREVMVRPLRTKRDWVHCVTRILEARWDQIDVLRLVLDNLNIHNPAAFYEVFDPAKARRLLSRLEFHYTPKHASWLNIAEIELSVLSTQCLNQRLPSENWVTNQVTAWFTSRNHKSRKVDWQFTTVDARTKLKRLYPSFSM